MTQKNGTPTAEQIAFRLKELVTRQLQLETVTNPHAQTRDFEQALTTTVPPFTLNTTFAELGINDGLMWLDFGGDLESEWGYNSIDPDRCFTINLLASKIFKFLSRENELGRQHDNTLASSNRKEHERGHNKLDRQ